MQEESDRHGAEGARERQDPHKFPTTGCGRVVLASSGARTASDRTALAVGDIAVAVQAPSRVLAAARAATRTQRRARPGRADPETQEAELAEPEAAAARPAARPARPAGAGGSGDLAGPFEARLREIGVTSPRFLRRASALDRNGQKIITEAATERLNQHASRVGPARVPGAGRLPSRQISHLPPPVRSPEQELEAEP